MDSDGKKIFIGFSSDTSGTMKYIAPDGTIVLFAKNPKNFTDIAEHWAKDNIKFVTERELFMGTGSSTFSPDRGMTRAMFAAVIGRLYESSYGKIKSDGSHAFSDVDYTAYSGTYIDWAAENNIISGIGGQKFAPNREITREEMAQILYSFARFMKVLPADMNTTLNYSDSSKISTWANAGALYCQTASIITGRDGGNFVPQGKATRAEVAAILQTFIGITVK